MAKRKPKVIESRLDLKLQCLKACITSGADEDAQEHLFDLLRALRLRNMPNADLTNEGRAQKALIE